MVRRAGRTIVHGAEVRDVQVAIVAGEASGDRVAGYLTTVMRRLAPELSVWGIGGQKMRDAGVDLVIDSSGFGVVGIAAGLRQLPRALVARRRLLRELARRKPDLLIAVDAGALNLGFGPLVGVCPWVRKNLPRTRIFYYFPPGSWRRTLSRTTLPGVVDRVVTPFPWNEAELRRWGVDAHFVGHPLLDLVRPSEPAAEFAKRYGVDLERPIVGLLPGSRRQEIECILPVLLGAAMRIHRRVPGTQFLIALAPNISRDAVLAQWNRIQGLPVEMVPDPARSHRPPPIAVPAEGYGDPQDLVERQQAWIERMQKRPPASEGPVPLLIVEQAPYEVMAASDMLLSASGTATLEAAILRRPMVIVYRMSEANRLEYHFVKSRIPAHVGMPNLLAQRMICPEFLQDAATPEAVADAAVGLLLDPERMQQMREDLGSVVALLGASGATERAARLALDLLGAPTAETSR